MEDKAMLRVGVLGVGGISGTHIPAWKRIKEAEPVSYTHLDVYKRQISFR